MTTYAHTLILDDSERIALESLLEAAVDKQGWEDTILHRILDKLQHAEMDLTSDSYFGQ